MAGLVLACEELEEGPDGTGLRGARRGFDGTGLRGARRAKRG